MKFSDVIAKLSGILSEEWEAKGDLDSDQLTELAEEISNEMDSIEDEPADDAE